MVKKNYQYLPHSPLLQCGLCLVPYLAGVLAPAPEAGADHVGCDVPAERQAAVAPRRGHNGHLDRPQSGGCLAPDQTGVAPPRHLTQVALRDAGALSGEGSKGHVAVQHHGDPQLQGTSRRGPKMNKKWNGIFFP